MSCQLYAFNEVNDLVQSCDVGQVIPVLRFQKVKYLKNIIISWDLKEKQKSLDEFVIQN